MANDELSDRLRSLYGTRGPRHIPGILNKGFTSYVIDDLLDVSL